MPPTHNAPSNGYYKPSNPIIPVDKVLLNTLYAFTLAPSNAKQYFSNLHRIKMVSIDMASLIISIKANISVFLELSSHGRLHWHGYILFPDKESIRDFYGFVIPVLLDNNQIEIDSIEDPEIWDSYIQKQHDIMQIYLDNLNANEYLKTNMRQPEIKVKNKKISDYNHSIYKPIGVSGATDNDKV